MVNEPRFADMPPARIVPALPDEGVYISSESTFQRLLRAQGQTRHRGRARAPRKSRPPSTHIATAPRQVLRTRPTITKRDACLKNAGRSDFLFPGGA